MGRRVAFSYFGICEYFLGERVLHQSDGEFRIPLAPPPEMTPVLAHDTFMEGMRTAGVPIHHLVGEVVTHSFFLSWFRSVSIGPIMRPFSTHPGATEVGGRLVEKYFQMRPLLAILEEDNRALIEENAHPRDRCATLEDPLVTLEAVPPYQKLSLIGKLGEWEWPEALDEYSSEQEAFQKLKLGNVASLFNVKINGHLVEAALGCWSPEFHVFKLGVFELCPALEEYGRLLSVPFDQDRIVLPSYQASWKSKASSFLRVKRGFLEKLDGDENYFRCSLKFFVDYFSPRNPNWISTPSFVGLLGSWPQYHFRALALVVVGHVLFSLSFKFIDMQVLEVVEQIMTGHSFILMLLAETFRALDRCVQKRGGFFRGCIFLLQVWLLEHLKCCNPLATPAFMRQDLIESHCSFSEIPPFLDSPEMWYDQLVLLAPDMLVLKCSWLHVVEIISSTSRKHHLILLGLRRSSHYFPNRVVRQFGCTQDIPSIEVMTDVVEFGPSSEKLISDLLVGWRSRVRSTFGDGQDSLATIEYIRWLGDCYPPYVSPSRPCIGEKRKDPMNDLLIDDQPSYKVLEVKVTSLLVENAGLKAEVAKMESEAAAY
ncbi:hypothetical protein HHK36_023375 [Tetracentron sinense]|uniref:DUF7745 domain-containing protein n=1 Tax=Tetracentron sinense TaxID=13715 RepID=A0A834YNK9_TETSI|nr:hypothetical protein HHK36_023375 [Tetracentron sinense]